MAVGADLKRLVQQVYDNRLIPGLVIGADAVLKRTGSAAYDPETGSMSGGTASETRRIMLRAYSLKEVARSGDLIIDGDVEIRMLAEVGKTAPETNDTVTVEGTDFRLVSVTPRYLDGAVIEYACQGRK